ncbi:MAG: hypothetical protein LAO79_12150 [Acidobacteriia bacterium]|nr:hypothetical protein [Terriglobia bacterium]
MRSPLGFWVFLLALQVSAQSVVTTIVGVDPQFNGSGQPSVNVSLGYVNGVALDSAGNIYFTDPLDHLVLKVSNGILTVLAGNGIADYSGDGGPATAAAMAATDAPEQYVPLIVAQVSLGGIAVDAQGNVFFADGHRVREITTDGTIHTVAGGGTNTSGNTMPATNAQLGIISGMVLDSAGNLYFSEANRIRRMTSGGTLSTYAGTGIAGHSGDGGQATAAQLWTPLGLAMDAQGNLYVADGYVGFTSPVIRRITPAGIISTIAGGGSKAPANGLAPLSVNLPQIGGLAVDSSGNLYLYGPNSGLLMKISGTAGNPFSTTTILSSPVIAPFTPNVPAINAYIAGQRIYDNSGIAVDRAGNLYVADSAAGYLARINPQGILSVVAGNGNYGFSGDGGPAAGARIHGPSSMTQTPDGTVYFVDSLNNRVRGISPAGIINTVLSASNYPAIGTAESIRSVVSDPDGNLYVLLVHRLIQLAPDGTITVLLNQAGTPGDTGDGGPALLAKIQDGAALARDAAGNLYIVDSVAGRIREITLDRKIRTIAGNGTKAFSADGAVAANASLSTPSSILIDGLGGIYFYEFPNPGTAGNGLIRYITPAGILKTIAGNSKGGYTGDGGPATQAGIRLVQRSGMLLDKSGNLFFTDGFNNVVRVISPDGIVNTYAGNGVSANAGDGGAPTDASFIIPQALLMDARGDMLIADAAANRIRAVLVAPPPITVLPKALNFSASAGGEVTAPKYLNITSPVSGLAFAAEISSTVDWLVVGAAGGATPQLIDVRIDPTSLAPGTYKAAILIASPLGNPANTSVPVTVTVGPAKQPALAVDRTGLSFTFPKNPNLSETQLLRVSNSGSGPLAFTATAQTANGGDWLTVNPSSANATPQKPANVSVTADSTALPVGTYIGAVIIASSTTGTSSTVRVTMTVSAFDQAIQLSHPGLSFTAVAGGGVIPPATFKVNNVGRGTMNFTVSTRTLSGGPWLSATPSAGAATPSVSPVVIAAADPTGLAPGFYYGQVRIDAPDAANTPHLATIALHVLPIGSDPGPAMVPAEIVFRTTQGAEPPGSAQIFVYNVSATPQSYVSRVLSSSPNNNFDFTPQSGTLSPDQPTRIVIQPLSSGLTAGVYEAELTLQFSDGVITRVRIRTIVAPPAATSSARLQPRDATCSPSQLVPVITVLGQSFSVPAAWPVALETTVADDCGNTLGAGSVTASFSNGDPPLSLQLNAADGTWSNTWVAGNTSGPVTVTVTANDLPGRLSGTRAVTGALGDPAPAPVVVAVVNSASFVQNSPLSPGSVISLGGTNLSNGTAQAQSIPLGTTLAGASVVMGSYILPMYYSSTGLINAVAPQQITVNTSHQIVVTHGTTISVPVSVDIGPADPAIFPYPLPGDPPAQGAIVNPVNYVVAQPGTPVAAGDPLAIFCTGLGAVDQPVADGDGAPVSPLARTVGNPTVSIGGQNAPVFFSGLTPGSVGLYQINVTVPAGITPGNQVPVTITMNGRTSPAATISVK